MSPAWPLPLRLYGAATGLIEPLAPVLLRRRVRRGKEDAARIGERLGHASLPRPPGPLVWIHGASVGESLSHLPLTRRWTEERPDVTVLVTSGTRTSAELLARRLPAGVLHQYAPIDAPGAAARFLGHWRPDLAVLVESELWPNLLRRARQGGARLALVGARISPASARAWDRAPASVRAVLGLFDLIYAQDSDTRAWLEDHDADVAGRFDLKRVADPLPCDPAELERLRAAAAGRTVLAAASTHAGEEAVVVRALRGLAPAPLLIVAPRHPERGPEAAAALSDLGLSVVRRSQGGLPGAGTDAYLVDTLGELGLVYRLADAVIMGGSLVDGLSGHNPLEPARLGRAVVTGPHVDAFADTYAELAAERAVLIARDPAELAAAVRSLLLEPALARALGSRALDASARGQEGFDRVWADLQDLLPA